MSAKLSKQERIAQEKKAIDLMQGSAAPPEPEAAPPAQEAALRAPIDCAEPVAEDDRAAVTAKCDPPSQSPWLPVLVLAGTLLVAWLFSPWDGSWQTEQVHTQGSVASPQLAEIQQYTKAGTMTHSQVMQRPALKKLLVDKGLWHLCDKDGDDRLTPTEWSDCKDAASLHMNWHSASPRTADANSDRFLSWSEICDTYPEQVCRLAMTHCRTIRQDEGIALSEWEACEKVVQWHRLVEDRNASDQEARNSRWWALISTVLSLAGVGIGVHQNNRAIQLQLDLHREAMQRASEQHAAALEQSEEHAEQAQAIGKEEARIGNIQTGISIAGIGAGAAAAGCAVM